MTIVSVSAAASSPASAQPRMRLFAHPLRLDNAGAIATVEQGSAVHAQQLTIAIVSTHLGVFVRVAALGLWSGRWNGSECNAGSESAPDLLVMLVGEWP